MFRRPRPANQPAAGLVVPRFDPWCGDREAPLLRAQLLAGDWSPLREALDRSDAARNDFLIRVITDQAAPVPAIDQWVRAESRTAHPLVVRGSQRINWAWAVRGAQPTAEVDPAAWATFNNGLLDAEVDLHQAIRLAPDDPLPWIRLMITGRALGMSVEEACDRFEESEARTPGLPGAADQLLQSLCEKWVGDHDTMFAFAREISSGAQVGDVRHRLVPMAHVERALRFREGSFERDAYRDNEDVREELLVAANRSVFHLGFGDGPEERITSSWFAFAFGYFKVPESSRPLLQRMGAAPAPSGFQYFADPDAVLARFRRDAGLQAPQSVNR